MIERSVRRPVTATALYVGLLVLGIYCARLIPVELLPEVHPPRLTVRAEWRGVSPETMEARATTRLESEAQRVRGVERIRSVSSADPGGAGARARITVEFAPGTRMNFARLRLRERINAVRDRLPRGVRTRVEPYVPDEFATGVFLAYRLHGWHASGALSEVARTRIGPELLRLDGVSAVRVVGGNRRVVSVLLDPRRLDALDLRAAAVRSRLGAATALRAPGRVRRKGRWLPLTLRTRAETLREVGDIVVGEGRGGIVRLADVAEVRRTTPEPNGYHRIDGRPAVVLQVHRRAGSDALALAARVDREMTRLRGTLPVGVELEVVHDRTEPLRAQIADLGVRSLASAAVIFLVLSLFLSSPKAVLVVFGTIGFSVLGAVTLLYLGGFSLNTLTMAGLAWGFGLVVDNAIVVLENVQRRREGGERPAVAARRGARQVALPVVAATATTAVVTVPWLALQGELRAWYLPLGGALVASMAASLVVAFTFVPAATARLGGRGVGRRRVRAPGRSRLNSGRRREGGARTGTARGDDREADSRSSPVYARVCTALLEAALDHPWIVVAACGACLAGSWWLFDQHVARGVRWSDVWGRQTSLRIQMRFPRGTGLGRTDELARTFEEKLARLPGVRRYETVVRRGHGLIRVTFRPGVEGTSRPVEVKERMLAYGRRLSGAEVEVYGYGPSFFRRGASPTNYSVVIFGFDYGTVRRIGKELARDLGKFSRVRNVDPDAAGRWHERERAFEFVVRPDRRRLTAAGLTVRDLARSVHASVRRHAAPLGLVLRERALPLTVERGRQREPDVRDLRDVRVRAGARGPVRIGDMAGIARRTVLSRIVRVDQEYRRTVAWEFQGPRALGDRVRDAVLAHRALPVGYRIRADRGPGWSEREARQVWWAVALGVLSVFMVTAAALESVVRPVVVLSAVPLALVGVFLVFFTTGTTFTRTAYVGTIMTAGIVVNNAILIVHRVDELRARLPTRQAIVRGTLDRVRPVLMTSLTTVLALLSLVAFPSSADANVWNALVLATVGGLLSSTVFALVALPVAYRYLVPGPGRAARS